jgi:hypothetical protein
LSRQQKDEDFTVTIDLELPDNFVHETEIRLVSACLGELLKRVMQNAESMEG